AGLGLAGLGLAGLGLAGLGLAGRARRWTHEWQGQRLGWCSRPWSVIIADVPSDWVTTAPGGHPRAASPFALAPRERPILIAFCPR
ncbi:MAG: hypothetical protein ACYCUF_06625, partial [Acidimicrobiales bacterium]